jgi:RNA recognition motif-containing protein
MRKVKVRSENRKNRFDSTRPYKELKNKWTSSNNKVFIENLPWDFSWQDLKDLFRSVGNVTHADIILNENNLPSGRGIVEFSNSEDAAIAIESLNNQEIGGRIIVVREFRERRFDNKSVGHRVYVGNLSWDVQWQDLKDHFKQTGHVLRADVMQEPDGRSKGCGIVEYTSSSDASRAISELNQTDLKGRTIFVREDREENIVR